jgi:hypothetical protein
MLRDPCRKAAAKVGIYIGMTVVLLVAIAGCSSTSSTTADTPALPRVTIHRTGGIAGVSDTLTIEASGAWTATDKAGTQRHGQLTAAQIDSIRTLATDPRLADEATRSRPPTQCRDAFDYSIDAGSVHVAYTDCPTDPNRPDAAIALVREVQSATR